MDCYLCKDNQDLLIKKFKHWAIIIHPNQQYLGRCMIKLNRHTVDLLDTTQEEIDELFEIMTQTRDALRELFKPDLFNYASMGNVVEHLHMHIIPRYKDKKLFKGMDFADPNWGHSYSPYDKGFKIPTQLLNEIRDSIKQRL